MKLENFNQQEFFLRSGKLPFKQKFFMLLVALPLFTVGLVGFNNIIVDLFIEPEPIPTKNLIFGVALTSFFLIIPGTFIYIVSHIENILILNIGTRQATLYKRFFFRTLTKHFPLQQIKISTLQNGDSQHEWFFTVNPPGMTCFSFSSDMFRDDPSHRAKEKHFQAAGIEILKQIFGLSRKSHTHKNDIKKIHTEFQQFQKNKKSNLERFRDDFEKILKDGKTDFESSEWFLKLKEVFYK